MNKIKVVIVEDDPMVLKVNSSFVEAVHGFKIVGTAHSGEQALRVIEKTKPDLVILDVYIPDIDGKELIMEIRKLGLPIDVLAVTAAQDGDIVNHMFRFGVVDYIIKPFNFKRFKVAMENYRERYSIIHENDEVLQDDIDRVSASFRYLKSTGEVMPKGLNQFTLEHIKDILETNEQGLTAEEVAERMGIARVTARRYLGHLEKSELVKKEIKSGTIGRPVHIFRFVKKPTLL